MSLKTVRKEDIYWMAGLLEGEGCFDLSRRTPRIHLGMTDQDIIDRYCALTGATASISTVKDQRRKWRVKDYYVIRITGARAAGIMQTVMPLMSIRRQQKIREVLAVWRSTRKYTKKQHRQAYPAMAA